MVFLVFLFVSLVVAQSVDPNACAQWPTCAECLKHNSCGWCATNVIYQDGTTGPHCAGKPSDPNHPPVGFKKWTCPHDYQNKACYGYVCDKTHYDCVSSGRPGAGVPLAECQKQCFPPTYICNQTTFKCDQTTPGHGTDKPSCEASCLSDKYVCDPTTFTCKHDEHGEPKSQCTAKCVPPTYVCNNKTFQCQQSTPGHGTDKNSCEAECRNDLYVCSINATCVHSTNGGGSKASCEAACKPHNNTPTNLIGQYRGLEVSKGFTSEEWDAKLTASTGTIWSPSGVWATGDIQTFSDQLWIKTSAGLRKGITRMDVLPEVTVLTWALGALGGPPPASFDSAMASASKAQVFVFFKCANPVCHWVPRFFELMADDLLPLKKVLEKRVGATIDDPCMKYPTCETCVSAPSYCGWCSIPVVYNGTIPGKQCAGVNHTITHATFNCSGSFTVETCPKPTTTTSSTTSHTTSHTTSTSTSTSSTTGQPDLYSCDPLTATCKKTKSGQPKTVCDAQCHKTPYVPILLQNKYFRGLQIQQNYIPKEFDANFTKTQLTFSGNGKSWTAQVWQVGIYVVFDSPLGVVSSIWQLKAGPVTDFLSWAWSAPNGPAPTDFTSAMTGAGQSELAMVSCPTGKPTSICSFDKE